MTAIPCHGYPTGALPRHHFHNCDITVSTKCPPEKVDSGDTCVWIIKLSVCARAGGEFLQIQSQLYRSW